MLVKTYTGENIEMPLKLNGEILALPALIDPHVHFRVPGGEHKEDWQTGSAAALAGGVTTVLDMPNNTPAVTTREILQNKKQIIDKQLTEVGMPLRYGLFIGATNDNFDEIEKAAPDIVGIKLFMGSSTGNLLVAEETAQGKLFELAARLDLVLAVHAEDEALIKEHQAQYPNPTIKDHSKIRDRRVAARAAERALTLAERFGTRLHILHCSTREEVSLIKAAKAKGVRVSAETTPHHLFLTTAAYDTGGTKTQMNPPLRELADQEALWEGLRDGTIDCIGTDHAPHTLEEKAKDYPAAPSGVPGIETFLPLLYTAARAGKISLDTLVAITHTNAQKIYRLPATDDLVFLDTNFHKKVNESELKTKCGWSPFAQMDLYGWPCAVRLRGQYYTF